MDALEKNEDEQDLQTFDQALVQLKDTIPWLKSKRNLAYDG